MDKTMTITSAQANVLFNAIMAKAKEDDSIEVDTHYGARDDGKSYFATSFDTFGKGTSIKSYVATTVTFYNDFITVYVNRTHKLGRYWIDIRG